MARRFLVPVELPGDVSAPLYAVPRQQLDAGLALKAADAAVVHLAGAETINGAKTFGTPPAVPVGNLLTHPVRRDDARLTDTRSPTTVADAARFGAVGDGVADDRVALQAGIDAAIAGKVPLHLPAGTFRVTGTLTWADPYPRIEGVGGGRSVIKASADGFDVLRVGTGTGQDGARTYGYLRDFGIEGFGNRPAKIANSSVALLVLDNVKFCTVQRLFLNRGDVCVDLRNNCYGSSFYDCAVSRYGESNVGVNLRAGPQSGNDIPFYNCWVGGAVASYHVSGAFTNLRLYGGQASCKQSTANVAADERGVFVVGRDYDTAAAAGLGQVTCDGVDVEGWSQGWAVRGFAQVGNLVFRNCTFFATTTGVDQASGVLKMVDAAQSQITFEDCEVKGTFSQAQVAQIAGSFSRFGMFERNWYASTPTTVATVAQSEGWLTSLREQSALSVPGLSIGYRGTRTELNWQGVILRTNNGVLEQSLDSGVSWRAVYQPAPRTATASSTYTADATLPGDVQLTCTGDTVITPSGTPNGRMIIVECVASGAQRTPSVATSVLLGGGIATRSLIVPVGMVGLFGLRFSALRGAWLLVAAWLGG